jgi:cytochrome c-type biogenesis protein CcmH
MMTFWMLTALFIAVALVMIAMPLLRSRSVIDIDRNEQNIIIARERLAELDQEREQGLIADEAFAETRLELEKVLAGDLERQGETVVIANRGGKLMLAVLGVAVPVLTIVLYYILGAPDYAAVSAPQAQLDSGAAGHAAKGSQTGTLSLEDMAERMAQRLQGSPDDVDSWVMLGRTYMAMKDYDKATVAYEQLYRLLGAQPQVLLSLADAIAMAQGGRMGGRPTELLNQALVLEPDNSTGLWMAGVAASEGGDYSRALEYFESLKSQLDENHESMGELRSLIARTRQQLSLPPEQESVASQPPSPVASASVQVYITLAPELVAEVGAEDTVFVYAKAQSGPPMPLAVVRKRAIDLPLTVTLDDSMAMSPAMTLSSFDRVKISARISKSGNAIAQSGDLIGELEGVTVNGTDNVAITISRKIP